MLGRQCVMRGWSVDNVATLTSAIECSLHLVEPYSDTKKIPGMRRSTPSTLQLQQNFFSNSTCPCASRLHRRTNQHVSSVHSSYCRVPLRTIDCARGQAGRCQKYRSQHLLRSMCVNTRRSSTAVLLCNLSIDLRTCTCNTVKSHVYMRVPSQVEGNAVLGGTLQCTHYCRRMFAFPTSSSSAGLPDKSTAR
jgi:hypothetical protein